MIVVGVKNKMMESKCCEIYDKEGFSASFEVKMRQINSFMGR